MISRRIHPVDPRKGVGQPFFNSLETGERETYSERRLITPSPAQILNQHLMQHRRTTAV